MPGINGEHILLSVDYVTDVTDINAMKGAAEFLQKLASNGKTGAKTVFSINSGSIRGHSDWLSSMSYEEAKKLLGVRN